MLSDLATSLALSLAVINSFLHTFYVWLAGVLTPVFPSLAATSKAPRDVVFFSVLVLVGLALGLLSGHHVDRPQGVHRGSGCLLCTPASSWTRISCWTSALSSWVSPQVSKALLASAGFSPDLGWPDSLSSSWLWVVPVPPSGYSQHKPFLPVFSTHAQSIHHLTPSCSSSQAVSPSSCRHVLG